MERSKDMNSGLSEVEIAYLVLKSGGQTMSFHDLMKEVFSVKGRLPDDPKSMAAVHTQINLDSRFISQGRSGWGLREWSQGKIVHRQFTEEVNKHGSIYRKKFPEDDFDEGENDNAFDRDEGEDAVEWE